MISWKWLKAATHKLQGELFAAQILISLAVLWLDSIVSEMVIWESSQWPRKNIAWSAGNITPGKYG